MKKNLYDIDVEHEAVEAADLGNSYFTVACPYVAHTLRDKCSLFKELLPEYRKHLKDSLGMNLDVTYEGGSNCKYRFKF